MSKKILVAEDNLVNQKVATMMLGALGFETVAVNNGKDAIALLEQQDFDMVLMDIQMPEMDGIEATKIVRDPKSKVRNHAIPIVAVTAYATEGERDKFLALGMDEYLTKPIDKDTVRAALEKVL